ncbi:hypothetical protein [Saccharothrix australiensis]|uniref:Sporulation and spore germination protein n=1 Tax=Saccharothrix australiensis TaxID=2072 RepID=A0A495W1H4_9PSEU|nr:hypothetical protein [Saccharothrix australiensis]RKT55244.1 hypothetical protein C8E97_3903 [Saccharothrix australiensis]
MRTVLAAAVALLLAGCGVQPSAPIPGSLATGALLYLVRDGAVLPVLRPTRHQTPPAEALALLVAGPSGVEQVQGFTSEVPPSAAPITLDGSTVTLAVDVTALSDLAVTQVACTAATPDPVTLVGGDRRRGPVTCPL